MRRPSLFTIGLACAVLALSLPAAHAASSDLMEAIRPALADIATIVILALVGWCTQRFSAWTGIQIEAKHREALQSALANGARIAVEGGALPDISKAVDYVLKSVPDALAHFGADRGERVRELLQPHIAAIPILSGLPLTGLAAS